jgi:hypothetical protein
MNTMTNCALCHIKLGAESIRGPDGVYCCVGCAHDGPCVCTYEDDLGRYPPSHYAKPVSLSELFDRYEKDPQKEADGR